MICCGAMLLTIAALAPLLAVFVLLVLARWPAPRAMPAAYVVATIVAYLEPRAAAIQASGTVSSENRPA